MTPPTRLLPDAEAEVANGAAWYESKRRGLGVEFVAAIDEAMSRIASNPDACPRWRDDRPYRMCVVHRFPYLVFYSVEGTEVIVAAVAHGKRKPGYWLGRTTTTRG